MAKQKLAYVTLLVHDYDEALLFYTEKLNFVVVEDTPLSETKRWVLIRPPGNGDSCILLAKAADEKQKRLVGNQTGGRVFLFLFTNDFQESFSFLKEKGVTIVREPSIETYGTVLVFEDLYGNLIDLIEPI